jgi:hypothetical protein
MEVSKMKVAGKLLISIALLQGAAYAQAPRPDEPKVDVVDGKISMSAQAIPLGRLLTLFDRAMGTKSEVKAGLGLENRNISVQFANLGFHDAVKKIFQGQPLNYLAIQGKGIRVMELAQGGTSSDSGFSSAPSFTNAPSFSSAPIQQPRQQNPVQQPAANPAASIFGGPAPATTNTNPSAPASGPGVPPPPIGASNPLIMPVGGAGGGANLPPNPAAPVPGQAPPAPGTLGGAAPGTIK